MDMQQLGYYLYMQQQKNKKKQEENTKLLQKSNVKSNSDLVGEQTTHNEK